MLNNNNKNLREIHILRVKKSNHIHLLDSLFHGNLWRAG